MSITFWLWGVLSALLTGFSKTSVPGSGILIVPLMAMVFPAKVSVGALLPMLVVGDVFAVAFYRRHAQWNKLWGLFPAVTAGMGLATWALLHVTDTTMKPILGWMVLILIGLELIRRRAQWDHVPHHWAFVVTMGFLAGFATTMGNVAGPIMTVYLLSRGMEKNAFIGTGAWYFLIVNVAKLPIYGSLHMITAATLHFNLLMLPAIILGALAGKWILPRIPQRLFTSTVLVLAAVAAVKLILP